MRAYYYYVVLHCVYIWFSRFSSWYIGIDWELKWTELGWDGCFLIFIRLDLYLGKMMMIGMMVCEPCRLLETDCCVFVCVSVLFTVPNPIFHNKIVAWLANVIAVHFGQHHKPINWVYTVHCTLYRTVSIYTVCHSVCLAYVSLFLIFLSPSVFRIRIF